MIVAGSIALVEANCPVKLLQKRIENDAETFAKELSQSEFASLAPSLEFTTIKSSNNQGKKPLVFMHGMGDSCFNGGMSNIAVESGKYLDVYSKCIPTGINRIKDTLNGFIMDMDTSVDVMANAIKVDSNFSNGFNCVGLSQGNNLCRGYIQKYNGIDAIRLQSLI